MTMGTSMPIHPAADLFPMLPASELQALADDIRVNGQREPVVLWDGQVLDGRNRLAACALAGVEPLTRTIDVCPDPVAFVLSLNLHRRHLDESQRGIVAAKVRPMLAEQAKVRQSASQAKPGEKVGEKAGDKVSPNLGSPEGKSADQAAAMLNVGRGTVEAAAKVLKHGAPELVAAVERGEVAVSVAAQVAALPVEEQREAVAGGAAAIRQKAKAIREAKPKAPAPPPAPARHPVLDEIDGAADLRALDAAFNRVALAGLGEDDSATAAEAYRRRSAELRAQAAPPSDASEIEALRAEIASLRAENGAYRAWLATVSQRATALAPTIKGAANLERIRFLVELSGSPNENESTNAARIACRMIREQGVKMLSSDPTLLDDIHATNRMVLDMAKNLGVQL